MRIVKYCLSVMVAGFLMTSLYAGAAEPSKGKKEDPVKKCQVGCQSNKDNDSYETCMLKCKDAGKNTSPAVPVKKK